MTSLIELDELKNNKEFLDYYEELNKFPYYTKITDELIAEFEEMDKPMQKMSLRIAKKHPFLWMKWVCGINPYIYQYKMLDDMFRNRFVIANTSRQIGKSLVIAGFAFWAAYNNVFPVGVDKKTKVSIVSATDDQAKKLLKDIYKMVQCADGVFAKLTRGTEASSKQYFTDKMTSKPTIFRLEFPGGTIECYPPTDKNRGNSNAFLMIDEGDFLNCEDPDYFFESVAMPTLKKTDGNCFVFSTPKGTPSYFRKLMNPDENRAASGWKRIWYNWTIYEDDWVSGWNRYLAAKENGTESHFAAEFEAKFTSGRNTFFDPDKVDECINEGREPYFESSYPVTIGLDYGSKVSRTVATFAYYDPKEEKSIIAWYKEFPSGFDNSQIVPFLQEARKRYRITKIIADDCPAGDTPTNLLRQAGFNVKLFSFKAEKQRIYNNVRIAIANKRIELYPAKDMIAQLKSIEEKMTLMGNIQIQKSKGMNDDICDSLIMTLSEFTEPRKKGRRLIL